MTHVDASGLEAAGFGGEAVAPGDPGYDDLRKVFNGMIDRRPALIARCTGASDVSAAVNFARDARLPVSVYGGGHGVTGNAVCDEGVMIDLRPINDIEVDPEARTCRAGAGLTWGELDAATQEHGLAVTGGRMTTTGISGLALGSGSGWIERKCGLTCDNLLSIEIVTADGQILTASETENEELFWGTRGGGGNFGVVTEFEFRLHPTTGLALSVECYFDPFDRAGVALITAPPEEFIPEPVRGQPVVGVIVCYTGPVQEGEEALRALREFGPPAMDMVQPMPYLAVQQLIEAGNPTGMRNYWTADFLAGLPDEGIETMCKYHLTKPSPLSQIILLTGGGAVARVPDDAMAFGQRQAPFNLHILSLWPEAADDEANIAWTREFGAAMKPYTTGRAYLNFIGEEGEDRVKAAFGPEAYARLQALKDRYDPDNLFCLNQNIKPSGAATGEVAAGAPA
jgi:FAD/FMN-containing dehydrogenase